MPTRFNSNSHSQFGVAGINDDTHQGTPTLTIPSIGIEDVDVALFKLFENVIDIFSSESIYTLFFILL